MPELVEVGSNRAGAGPGSKPAATAPLLELRDVSKVFPVRAGILRRVRSHVHAVSNANLRIAPGETLGLVGESGSGKSTLGRLALQLIEATSGTVVFDGAPVGRRDRARLRRDAQMVFQDPYSSFDPSMTIEASIGEPLDVHLAYTREQRYARLCELVDLVGLSPVHLTRFPRELSGGQLQRLAMARALAAGPRLIVLDEPVSSLDVSTQAQVINLLEELQRRLGVAYLFIAHNPALVAHASDRIAVMYLGQIVEVGSADEVYNNPKHPYTQALLSAVAVPDPDEQRRRQRIILHGDIPNPANPPSGCRFRTRCPHVMAHCSTDVPPAFDTPDGSVVHCHLHTSGPTLGGASVTSLPLPAPRRHAHAPIGWAPDENENYALQWHRGERSLVPTRCSTEGMVNMSESLGFSIEIDREICMGSGVCSVYAGATFVLDESAHAVASDPPGDTLDAIRTAVEACPTGAIKLIPA